MCVRVLPTAFKNLIQKSHNDVLCGNTFAHFSGAFAIVDVSPILITGSTVRQEQYYSGKLKCHCVKVQALITPDGLYVHMSAVFRSAIHDKAIFDHSGVTQFVTYRDEWGLERQRVIIGDLGYVDIERACPNAVLPQTRVRGGGLTEEQGAENQLIASDRILVENFCARWKNLFGICEGKYREDLAQLNRIVRMTVALTNWYIARHPLRAEAAPGDQRFSDNE
jgi:hypothetical protein